jgi:hypothetical protein
MRARSQGTLPGFPAPPPPLESGEQAALFDIIDRYAPRYPQLRLIFHIPNGENRGDKVLRRNRKTGQEYWYSPTGAKLKRMGVRPGVLDIFCAVASKGYHGLFIEMKRQGEKPEAAQVDWIEALLEGGYLPVVCYSSEEAWETICNYLEIPR